MYSEMLFLERTTNEVDFFNTNERITQYNPIYKYTNLYKRYKFETLINFFSPFLHDKSLPKRNLACTKPIISPLSCFSTTPHSEDFEDVESLRLHQVRKSGLETTTSVMEVLEGDLVAVDC